MRSQIGDNRGVDDLYGGTLEDGGGAERGQDAGVLAALAGRDGAEALTDAPGLVVATPEGEGVTLRPALASRPLFLVTSRPAGLAHLARVARALAALHAAGRWHGDVRPETVRLAADQALLVTSSRQVDAGRLLAARLRAGAPPVAVAYAAPEVVAGGAGAASADVYALAALAYQLVAGRPPLGALDLPAGPLGAALGQALAPDPARRGDAGALALALEAGEAPATPPPVGAAVEEEQAWDEAPPTKEAVAARAGGISVILALVLGLGGVFVVVGAVTLVALGWETLGRAGQFGLLFLLTGGLLGAGLLAEARGFVRTGFALLAIGTQLLWADGLFLIIVTDANESSRSGLLLALGVTGVTWGLAVARGSAILGSLAALDAIAAWAFLGDLLSSRSDTGPPVFLLLVAAGYAALTWAGDRLGGRRPAVPTAIAACGAACVSGLSTLWIVADQWYHDDLRLFGSVWPYVPIAAALGVVWLVRPGVYRTIACVAAGLLLTLVPTLSALFGYRSIVYVQAAVLVGGAALGAAFFLPAVAERSGRQLLVAILGTLQAVFATGILALVHCGGRGGRELLDDLLASPGGLLDTRFAWLSAAIGVATGLVGVAALLSRRARRPLAYRFVEAAGILLFFFVLTILSLLETDDVVYPLVVLGWGTGLLVAGILGERVMLVLGAVVGLSLNAWVQYFARLHGVLPTPLLMIGFGLSILVAGVLYERKVKGLLAGMKGWA